MYRSFVMRKSLKSKLDALKWDRVAPDYIKSIKREKSSYLKYLIYESLFSNIFDLVGEVKNKVIIDAGCGEGRLSRLLAERGGKVYGFDVSSTMIKEANFNESARPLGIKYFIHDLTEPLPDSRMYDIVIANLVLFNIHDLNTAVANISKILKPNGKFIFSLLHPCFNMTKGQWYNLRYIGRKGGKIVFDIKRSYKDNSCYKKEFFFLSGEVNFYHRPIETYFKTLSSNNLLVSDLLEPVLKINQIYDEKTYHHHFLPRFLVIKAAKN